MMKLVQFKRNEDLDTSEQVLVHEILANYQKIGTVYKIPQDQELPIFYPDENISKILGYDNPITNISDTHVFQRYRYEITEKLKNWSLRDKPRNTLEISSSGKKIKDLQEPDKVLSCIQAIRTKFSTRILFSTEEPDLDENTRCGVFYWHDHEHDRSRCRKGKPKIFGYFPRRIALSSLRHFRTQSKRYDSVSIGDKI